MTPDNVTLAVRLVATAATIWLAWRTTKRIQRRISAERAYRLAHAWPPGFDPVVPGAAERRLALGLGAVLTAFFVLIWL